LSYSKLQLRIDSALNIFNLVLIEITRFWDYKEKKVNIKQKITSKIESGFTMIEILVVLAIIAILSAIVSANFLDKENDAKGTQIVAAAEALAGAVEAHRTRDSEQTYIDSAYMQALQRQGLYKGAVKATTSPVGTATGATQPNMESPVLPWKSWLVVMPSSYGDRFIIQGGGIKSEAACIKVLNYLKSKTVAFHFEIAGAGGTYGTDVTTAAPGTAYGSLAAGLDGTPPAPLDQTDFSDINTFDITAYETEIASPTVATFTSGSIHSSANIGAGGANGSPNTVCATIKNGGQFLGFTGIF